LCGHSLIQIIGDNPVNVTVCGNYLEQLHFERNFFELDTLILRKNGRFLFDNAKAKQF